MTTTDFSKLDAGLAARLDAPGSARSQTIDVMIELASEPDAEGRELLDRLGVDALGDAAILTASLPLVALRRLSEEPWVRYLRLAPRLQPGSSSAPRPGVGEEGPSPTPNG